MEVNILAITLLTGRLITLYYLGRVLKTQVKLLRMPIEDPNVWDFRKTLHYMTIVVALGNLVPIAIDLVSIFGPTRPFWLGVLYAISNVITALFAAILIHKMYRLASQTKEVNDLEREYVKQNTKK